jgi:hypothetical protein
MVLTVAAASATLSFSHVLLLLLIVVVGMLLAGMVVVVGRYWMTTKAGADSGTSLVRSWIAISLVLGLLVFCATAFLISDTSLRSTLFGGLVASVGAAVAFYFSSQQAAQARSDILNATVALAQGGMPPTGFLAMAPPAARVGSLYSYPFKANGSPTPQYALASSALPDHLVLGADGVLEGTPAPGTAGDYTFTIKASNPAGSVTSPDITLHVDP